MQEVPAILALKLECPVISVWQFSGMYLATSSVKHGSIGHDRTRCEGQEGRNSEGFHAGS